MAPRSFCPKRAGRGRKIEHPHPNILVGNGLPKGREQEVSIGQRPVPLNEKFHNKVGL